MGAPERKAKMESEKMMQSEDTSTTLVAAEAAAADSPRDQFAWAQYMHDSQFFDFSPKALSLTPRFLDSPTGASFPDLSAICQSPMFADQWKFLWSPRTATADTETSTVPAPPPPEEPAAPPAPPSVSDQVKSLNLSRLNNSERGVSTSATTSCESEGPCSSSDVKPGMSCAESIASGDERTRRRKRATSGEREEEEPVDDVSDAEEMEESKDIANKPSRSKQQKVKSAKRLREPRIAIKTRTEVDIMEDGYKWRKYGQKPVKNSPHPRNYYRCTTANCPVRKRVERSIEDPGLVVTSYEGTHTHPKVNQPKRTASGSFAPMEAAESLSESLNQLQNRQAVAAQQAAASSTSSPAQFPPLFPGSWPGLNRPGTDNVGLMMAYQIVRLQWELQAKTQQFMNYNAGLAGGYRGACRGPTGGLPFGFPGAMPDMSALLSGSFGEGSDSDVEAMRFPKVPEALSSGSGLLARRAAAQRTGSPLNPNLQSNTAKVQQLIAQAMAGLQQAALSEPQEQPRPGDQGHGDQGQ